MTITQLPTFYTEAQTAALLSPKDGPQVSRYTVRRLRLAGLLGHTRIGRRIVHTEAQIQAYIDSQTEAPCKKNDDPGNSGNTGSHSGKTPRSGAGRGSTRKAAAGKPDALHLAREILRKRKLDSPSGTSRSEP